MSIKNILRVEKKPLEKHETVWFVLLLIIIIYPVFRTLLKPGYFYMQDDLQAFRIHQLDKCIQDGQFPCRWVPDAGYGYGYPQFIFYSPGVYYLGELIHLFGFQFIDSVKILFILGYLLSALGMFVLVKSFADKWSALVSSILYTYVPYKAVEVYVRGAMSEFWSLVFFPFIFWASYMFIKKVSFKYFIWLSVFIGLLLITHNLMPTIFLPILTVWVIYWLWHCNNWKIVPKVMMSAILGVGLSAFFVLPMILERRFVHSESLLGGYFDYRQHFVSLYKLFISTEWGYGSSGFPNEVLNLSTGLIQWVFGLISILVGIFTYKRNRKISILIFVLGILELIVLFMIHMKSSFLWSALPFLSWLQFPWRFLTISIFLLAIICGLGIFILPKYKVLIGVLLMIISYLLNINNFQPRNWYEISDNDKFSGISWQKQQTISIFDYLPIYAKLPPVSRAPDYPEILTGDANFIDYQKGSNWQRGEVEIKKASLLRLPFFDFPGMTVKVDDQKVKYVNNDCRNEDFCLGLITFNVPVGRHIIEARLESTPLRKLGSTLSLISVIIVFYLIVKSVINEKIQK